MYLIRITTNGGEIHEFIVDSPPQYDLADERAILYDTDYGLLYYSTPNDIKQIAVYNKLEDRNAFYT